MLSVTPKAQRLLDLLGDEGEVESEEDETDGEKDGDEGEDWDAQAIAI